MAVAAVSFAVALDSRVFIRAPALPLCSPAPHPRQVALSGRRCWEVVRSSRNGNELFLDNDVNAAVLATRNALQVQEASVSDATADSSSSAAVLLSAFEGLLMKKGDEVTQELAERSYQGTSIFLIGMMACGKSTVGRIVANALHYEFSDSDDVIESYVNGVLVKEIFRLRSEEEFRDLEKLVTRKCVRVVLSQTRALQDLSQVKQLVVATGGGAVVRDDNWAYLREGIIVWLDVPLEDLAKRVTAVGPESRPLLGGKCRTFEETFAKLSELMHEREPYYSRAHCKLSFQALASSLQLPDVGALTPTAIAVQVLEEIKEALQQEKYIPPPIGF